jgi:hypothetical protein
MKSLLVAVVVVLLASAAGAQPIDIDMFIGSSAPGSGRLEIAYRFCRPVLVTPSVSAGGVTRWTATQPGFNALAQSRPGSIYVLQDNTPVEVELTAVDAGVTLKVGSALLDAPGAAALIGNAPNLHLHPEWRLLLPDGQHGEYHVELKLRTGARGYGDSTAYEFAIVTDPPAVDPCAGGTTTTTLPVTQADHLVSGALLRLRSAPTNPARKTMLLAFSAFDAGGVDPTATGGQLRVLSNVGSGFEGRYELPATGWRPLRRRGAIRGYRYVDRHGPIRSVKLENGAVRVAGRGIGLAHTLAADPSPVDVALALGTQRACLRFGGTTTFKGGRTFKAENAPPPDTCAP